MNQEIIKLRKLEIDLDELTEFIVKAKRKGYAGDGKYKILKDGSKLFTFQEGNFYYEDRYRGSSQAPGRELVKWKDEDGQGVWFMSYSGGMLPEFWEDKALAKKTFAFLKETLSKISKDKPFRGPEGYESEKDEFKDFLYRCQIKGDIKRFKGQEEIHFKKLDNIIFSQDFIGCLVVPK